VWEHKEGIIKGFTYYYKVNKLVYYEIFDDVTLAIHREKIIKKWKRRIKYDAIRNFNPEWEDLYHKII